MRKSVKAISILLTPVLVLALQVGSFSAAHALGNADLSVSTSVNFSDTTLEVRVCNNGPEEVTKFVLNNTLVNFPVNEALVSVATSDTSHGSTLGTFDEDSSTWTGNLLKDDCIHIMFNSNVAAGQNVSLDSTIVSSELTGAVPNVDPNSSNDVANTTSFVKGENSNLDIQSRLLTQGAISPETVANYELTLKNSGPGAYVDNGFFLVGFVMPTDATFTDMTVTQGSDVLTVTACQVLGPIANLGFSSLSEYSGNVVACFLQASSDLPVNSTYKFNISMTAGDSFSNGDAKVIAIAEGNDADTYKLFSSIATGADPFNYNTGNFTSLAYDPSQLNATASLCPGQLEVSSDGTGCFRFTFNKAIYENSFGLDDIIVSGSGSATSLTKISDGVWEIKVSGITKNTTATISLNLGGILDYSSIGIQTKVLGIDTIRYAESAPVVNSDSSVPTTPTANAQGTNSASGVLSSTGTNVDLNFPMFLILIGGLFFAATSIKKKKMILLQSK